MNCLKNLSFGESKDLENDRFWSSRYVTGSVNPSAMGAMEFPLHLTHRGIFLPEDFRYGDRLCSKISNIDSSGLEATHICQSYVDYYSRKRSFQLIIWKTIFRHLKVHFAVW